MLVSCLQQEGCFGVKVRRNFLLLLWQRKIKLSHSERGVFQQSKLFVKIAWSIVFDPKFRVSLLWIYVLISHPGRRMNLSKKSLTQVVIIYFQLFFMKQNLVILSSFAILLFKAVTILCKSSFIVRHFSYLVQYQHRAKWTGRWSWCSKHRTYDHRISVISHCSCKSRRHINRPDFSTGC